MNERFQLWLSGAAVAASTAVGVLAAASVYAAAHQPPVISIMPSPYHLTATNNELLSPRLRAQEIAVASDTSATLYGNGYSLVLGPRWSKFLARIVALDLIDGEE